MFKKGIKTKDIVDKNGRKYIESNVYYPWGYYASPKKADVLIASKDNSSILPYSHSQKIENNSILIFTGQSKIHLKNNGDIEIDGNLKINGEIHCNEISSKSIGRSLKSFFNMFKIHQH